MCDVFLLVEEGGNRGRLTPPEQRGLVQLTLSACGKDHRSPSGPSVDTRAARRQQANGNNELVFPNKSCSAPPLALSANGSLLSAFRFFSYERARQ